MIKIEKATLDMISEIKELEKNFTYPWSERLIGEKIQDNHYLFL